METVSSQPPRPVSQPAVVTKISGSLTERCYMTRWSASVLGKLLVIQGCLRAVAETGCLPRSSRRTRDHGWTDSELGVSPTRAGAPSHHLRKWLSHEVEELRILLLDSFPEAGRASAAMLTKSPHECPSRLPQIQDLKRRHAPLHAHNPHRV